MEHAGTRYRTPDGRVLFVGRGIGRDDCFMTFYQRTEHSKRRFRGLRLPVRPTAQEAQADLDAYAASHKLLVVDDGKAERILRGEEGDA